MAARSVAALLLRLWVRIPQGAWMLVCYKCCVLSGIGLSDELITCPEKSLAHWGLLRPKIKNKNKRK